ncbi:MAG: hypothetical protein ABI651_16155 [Verrucomicrobiota bacterium]
MDTSSRYALWRTPLYEMLLRCYPDRVAERLSDLSLVPRDVSERVPAFVEQTALSGIRSPASSE